MPLYRAAATSLVNLVAADGASGGFVQDAQAGAAGLAILDDASIAAVQQTLSGAGSTYAPVRVLWYLDNADMNVTTDQQFTKAGTFTNYIAVAIKSAWVSGANPVSLAAGGIYTAAGKGGFALVASTQTYTNNAGSNTGTGLTIAGTGHGVRADAALYLSLTSAQGAASIANVYIMGVPLS